MPLLAPPSVVVNVLAPLALALIDAVTVWLTVEPVPLESLTKKFVTVFVSIVVVVVYLLAVVDSRESPADNAAKVLVLSVNPAHRCGFVPWAASFKVNVFELRLAGALGVDFITKVTVSLSLCAIVSGVPIALKSVSMLPALTPVKFLSSVLPIVPAVEPSSANVSTSEESFWKSYSYSSAFWEVLVYLANALLLPSKSVTS